MAPALQGVILAKFDLPGCGHLSGLFARRLWPLALMVSADQVPLRLTSTQLRQHLGLS